MSKAEAWASRVAAWRASGQTSTAFCEGKDFTAGGLRHWAHLLRKREAQASRGQTVRIARVVRPRRAAARAAVASRVDMGEPVTIELGGARIAVGRGFDRATLAAVLEVLATGGCR
jgi:hypothetical protein